MSLDRAANHTNILNAAQQQDYRNATHKKKESAGIPYDNHVFYTDFPLVGDAIIGYSKEYQDRSRKRFKNSV